MIQVRVEPLLADRHKMYFGTTETMLSQLDLYYNSTTHFHTGAPRLPLWTYAPGTDCYERQGFFKVLLCVCIYVCVYMYIYIYIYL